MENNQQRADEIEALSSIYGDDWRCENETRTSFSIEINKDVKLYITLNEKYPSQCPPTYVLQAPYLSKEEKAHIEIAFSDIYLNHIGDPILYEWIEKLKELVRIDVSNEDNCSTNQIIENAIAKNENKLNFLIHHGDIITDRKSAFQGHACIVNNQEDIKLAMEQLLQNKKIAQATHNILSYRITLSNGNVLQDCKDDGETNAGSRLMHLLQILNVKNVMVVVSRWYGGVHLGPDRFKHINNAARDALVKANIIQ